MATEHSTICRRWAVAMRSWFFRPMKCRRNKWNVHTYSVWWQIKMEEQTRKLWRKSERRLTETQIFRDAKMWPAWLVRHRSRVRSFLNSTLGSHMNRWKRDWMLSIPCIITHSGALQQVGCPVFNRIVSDVKSVKSFTSWSTQNVLFLSFTFSRIKFVAIPTITQ